MKNLILVSLLVCTACGSKQISESRRPADAPKRTFSPKELIELHQACRKGAFRSIADFRALLNEKYKANLEGKLSFGDADHVIDISRDKVRSPKYSTGFGSFGYVIADPLAPYYRSESGDVTAAAEQIVFLTNELGLTKPPFADAAIIQYVLNDNVVCRVAGSIPIKEPMYDANLQDQRDRMVQLAQMIRDMDLVEKAAPQLEQFERFRNAVADPDDRSWLRSLVSENDSKAEKFSKRANQIAKMKEAEGVRYLHHHADALHSILAKYVAKDRFFEGEFHFSRHYQQSGNKLFGGLGMSINVDFVDPAIKPVPHEPG